MVSYGTKNRKRQWILKVLILVVVDNGLVHTLIGSDMTLAELVLILVVVDNGLVQNIVLLLMEFGMS